MHVGTLQIEGNCTLMFANKYYTFSLHLFALHDCIETETYIFLNDLESKHTSINILPTIFKKKAYEDFFTFVAAAAFVRYYDYYYVTDASATYTKYSLLR